MTPERWEGIKAAFSQALGLQGHHRRQYLEAQKRQDPELAVELARLLANHEEAGDFLETPVAATISEESTHQALTRGDRLGVYTVIRKIGQGGMGTVYLAQGPGEQKNSVAVKLLHPDLAVSRGLARFRSEQKALGLMQHHNIAALYETHQTRNGIPYFVMEYVPGLPITRLCDHQQLDTKKRLRLLLQAMDGVEHAHQKGIIHRDLKPSNVLVTQKSGSPLVKLIDFGIVKATEQLKGESFVTYSDVILGSLRYMSPEQAGVIDVPVGPYTDIYALGILAYELMTGLAPFAEMDLFQQVGTLEPAPPSSTFAAGAVHREKRSQLFGAEPEALKTLLEEGLDAIILKAVAKNPDCRYGTIGSLRREIQQFLQEKPRGKVHAPVSGPAEEATGKSSNVFQTVGRFLRGKKE